MIRAAIIALSILVASSLRADAVLFSTQGVPAPLGFLLLHTANGKITLHQGGALQCHTC
jgi:hypothetical protein